ncbi:hypothetical protein M514_14932 [Trichuris suis]|uniref:Uncharacterized protein n=1 Tax=Trichuris suis TaxID=68888 RepID=A0A085NU82_9BILA|nr:hypothetical protein M514_14932 [Trichuris suis]
MVDFRCFEFLKAVILIGIRKELDLAVILITITVNIVVKIVNDRRYKAERGLINGSDHGGVSNSYNGGNPHPFSTSNRSKH